MHFTQSSPHFIAALETSSLTNTEMFSVNVHPLLWSCHNKMKTCKHFISFVNIAVCDHIIVHMMTFIDTRMSRLVATLLYNGHIILLI